MKKIKIFTVGMVSILSCAILPSIANATNGMFLIGNGNKAKGMGGAGIAVQADALSAATNPATIAGMANRFDIGVDIFKPDVEAQLGSVSSSSTAQINGMGIDSVFILPSMGGTYQLSDTTTLGLSVVPVGGGGTKYKSNFFEAAAAGSANAPGVNTQLGVDLVIGEIVPTIAYKVNKINSFGASLIIGIARFSAYGIGLFDPFTQTQGTTKHFSDQGRDWVFGTGVRVGWLGDFGKVKVGVEYTSKVWMQTYKKYTELFAENGSMDIPANAGLGISFQATPDLLLAVDISRTFYNDVKSIANKGPNLAGNPSGPLGSNDRKLGLSNGLGFGWGGRTVYKIGAEYNINEKWIARAGWDYSESPINEDTQIIFNLVAPATVQNHLTLGGTYNLSSDMAINASYIHAYRYEQNGPTYISDNGSNLGRLSMSQDTIGISFSMSY